jgi:2-O-(6-phospho-alpha-D-mannosyl)-D-glycerate hydrolase
MSKIHIISHTHWDREWYKPFQYFRVKLVYVIDKVLDILERNEDFRYFLLDGQSIVLEDYLQIKPENEYRLRNLIQAGRIVVGPWYVQPDEFVPDGESLIRNLLLGIDIAEKFGKSMMVGYLPDSFGHSGQLPHILKGFGIDSAVIMRGVDVETIGKSEIIWEGTNGDEVLGIFLPNGYTNAMFLPEDFLKAKLRLGDMVRKLKKWAATDNILIMNGVDHQFPQEHVVSHIEKLNTKSRKDSYCFSTIENYIDDIKAANAALPRLKGDLLTPIRNRVHSSIASTRVYQKQQNRRLEALLEKYVEPIATMAWLQQAEYPTGLINQAWKILIQNQTHDGMGGCCTDEVHREMDQRFVDVKNIGERLRNTYARAISRRISTNKLALVVFNNAMTRGRQLVQASVYSKDGDFLLKDMKGEVIPYQVDQMEALDISQLNIWMLYLDPKEEVQKVDISFYADFDFNVGYKVFDIIDGKSDGEAKAGVRVSGKVIENEYARVEIHPNGSIALCDKESEICYEDLHVFKDCGDAGDTYNFSPVLHDTVITSREAEAEVSIAHQGPLSVTATIRLVLDVPLCLVNQDQERSAETVKLPVTTRMTVHAGLKRIDFVTEVDNIAEDHRLRVLFPAGMVAEHSYAESQFGTAMRPNRIDTMDWQKKKWSEKPLPIYGQQKFVALNDGKRGLAVLNRGLPEYEIYNGETSTIAVTLFRGVGQLGKSDLLIRPGRPSGLLSPTPDAQCKGLRRAEYALFPHTGGLDAENVAKMAAEYDAGALSVQNCLKKNRSLRFKAMMEIFDLETLTEHIKQQMNEAPKEDFRLVTVNCEHLLFSAVKKAEKEDALIVRLYNASAEPIVGATVFLGISVDNGYLVGFCERDDTVLNKGENGAFDLPAVKPYSAVSLKFPIAATD